MVSHATRRRVTFEADRFEGVLPRGDAPSPVIDVEDLAPPPARRGLLDSLPTEPFPTEALLTAAGCAVQPGGPRELSSHEVIRHLHVDARDALDRFGEWWPVRLRVRGGVFETVDRTPTVIEGRLRRPLARRLRVDLALEIHSEALCAIRLIPELRSRRLVEPTEMWWATAHALADVVTSVVRPRQDDPTAC